jgi:thiol-disulfide isomerase/thioredoxin
MGIASAQLNVPMTFILPMIDGSAFVRLADFVGRPVVINFWSSACQPCLKEMPVLLAYAKERPDVQFLGVAVDNRASAVRFLAEQPSMYPQLIAVSQPEVLLRRFGDTYAALPHTVVLDATHSVCAIKTGEIDRLWIQAALIACDKPKK